MKSVFYGVCGVLCVACGGSGGLGQPIVQFPSRGDLDSLADHAPTEVAANRGVADAEQWEMQTADVRQTQYPSDTPLDQLLVSSAAVHGNGMYLSPQLRCAAQEAARFYVEHGGFPDDGLREHLLVRCGSTLPSHGVNYVMGEVPDSVSEAELQKSLRPQVQKLLDKELAVGHGELAAGYARGKGRYIVTAFNGEPQVELNDFSPVVTGDSVTLKGVLKVRSVDSITGLATHGTYGVSRCDADPTKRLPAFSITCPIGTEDATARIELAIRKPGQVLMSPVAQLEVRHQEQADLTYNAATYGTNKPAADPVSFRAALFQDLNETRKAAGLRPFTLEPAESHTAERLAPYLFQTMALGEEDQVSTITLGLLAGWDVHGTIRDGGFFFDALNASRNPTRWLSRALASPLGRWVLLEPEATHIAIGASPLAPSGVTAIVTTYSFFDAPDHRADEDAAFAELNRQRHAHGVAEARRINSDQALKSALTRVNKGTSSTSEALHVALTDISQAQNRPLGGYIMETTDLHQLKFDREFVESSTLDVEIGVTHYRAPGAAWGQYALLFVVVNHGPVNKMAEQHPSKAHVVATRRSSARDL